MLMAGARCGENFCLTTASKASCCVLMGIAMNSEDLHSICKDAFVWRTYGDGTNVMTYAKRVMTCVPMGM